MYIALLIKWNVKSRKTLQKSKQKYIYFRKLMRREKNFDSNMVRAECVFSVCKTECGRRTIRCQL